MLGVYDVKYRCILIGLEGQGETSGEKKSILKHIFLCFAIHIVLNIDIPNQ